ncbi:MAG: HAMP domain-containing histidine kinase [Gemmatimonadetes bacterium]|nr:HAMP domain-containing histidine kinase [Gemmatimonadota bacterium]
MQTRPWSRTSSLWLQLLLVGGATSIALMVVSSWRAMTAGERVAERALADYASFAAWSFRQHATVAIREIVDVSLGPVNHGEGHHEANIIPDARDMWRFLRFKPRCECPLDTIRHMPELYYGFTLGTDTVSVADSLSGARQWSSDQQQWVSDVQQRHLVTSTNRGAPEWTNARFTELVRARLRPVGGYNVAIEAHHRGPRAYATRLMPTHWGDTIVYVAAYRPATLDSLFRRVFNASDLLPPALVRDRRNEDIIDLELFDRAGRSIFRSREPLEYGFPARTYLPAEFDSVQVAVRVRPELAGTLLIGGTPTSYLPVLLILLVVAVGLTLLGAVQLRREARFALERTAFVANVSHELRTPLAQVRLVLDTLRLGRAGSEEMRASALALADREVLRLQHLVEGVLRFARGSRNDEATRVVVDPVAEAQQVAAEFAPLASPRGIRIEVSGDAVPSLRLERDALRQVLLNLLDNAVKYGANDAPVRVHVDDMGGAVRISVIDAGPGIAPDERERIWKAYERGAQARERAAGGSGIGLAIVKDIALAHGGTAQVENAPGGGSCFVVTFPPDHPRRERGMPS